MQTFAALLTVIAVINWVSYIGGLVLSVASPSVERAGYVAGHTLITAVLVAVTFQTLERTHGAT